MSAALERTLSFECEGARLFGILHQPKEPSLRGVLVVVGGPQYRVGSHRQFVLLGRALACSGVYAMRFDYRGMGDSEGAGRTFEDIDADIRAAIDAFFDNASGLTEVVIWGLCDAASAALFYGYKDARVTGLVLVNPWARSEETIARAYLRHYYMSRIFSRSLWRKIAGGRFRLSESLTSLLGLTRAALRGKPDQQARPDEAGSRTRKTALAKRMAEGLERFNGRVLFVLSGDDMTASEFRDTVSASRQWRKLMKDPRVLTREIPEANHTFSRREWRDEVSSWTAEWVRSW